MSQNNGIYTVAARFDADCTPTHVFVARKSATTTNYARNRIDKTFVVGVCTSARLAQRLPLCMDTYMMWECEHKIVSRLMSICMCNALVKGAKHCGARAGRETLLQSDLLRFSDCHYAWTHI